MSWNPGRSETTMPSVEPPGTSPNLVPQFCEGCGSKVEIGARFCGACGQEVPEPLGPQGGPESLDAFERPFGPPDAASSSGWGLERFRFSGVLGRGGSGTVYLVYDAVLGRDVALKILDPDLAGSSSFLRRYWAEVETMSRLHHPHVVEILDHGEEHGRAWLVTEYVEGASLRQVLERSDTLTAPQALGLLAGALDGLAFVHGSGVIHGDITPGNILVDRLGVSKLADFGESLGPTGRGAGMTPAYASPEAAKGLALDARSDLYSLGVVLYECLAGHPPFNGQVPEVVLHRQVTSPPPPVPGLPAPLADLVAHSLAKDPAQRPQSAGEFLARLEEAAAKSEGPRWRERAALVGLGAVAGGEVGALAGPLGSPAGRPAGSPTPLAASRNHRGATTASGPTQAPHQHHQKMVGRPRRLHRPVAAPRKVWRRLASAAVSHKVAAAAVAGVVAAGSVGAGLLSSKSAPTAPGVNHPTTTSSVPSTTIANATTSTPAATLPAETEGTGTWIVGHVPPRATSPSTSLESPRVTCTSPHHCLVVGAANAHLGAGDTAANGVVQIYLTTAHGNHLQPVTVPSFSPPADLGPVSCPTPTACMLAAGHLVLRTFDGGTRWLSNEAPAGIDDLTHVSCANATTCFAAQDGSSSTPFSVPKVMTTSDFGQHWSVAALPSIARGVFLTGVRSLECPTVRRCWMVVDSQSNSPFLLSSADGGRHWQVASGLPTKNLAQLGTISCVGTDDCTVTASWRDSSGAMTNFGVVSTHNGGLSWQNHPLAFQLATFNGTYSVPRQDVSLSCVTTVRCMTTLTIEDPQDSGPITSSYLTSDGWVTHRQITGPVGWVFSGGISCPDTGTCVANVQSEGTAPRTALAHWDPTGANPTTSSRIAPVTWQHAPYIPPSAGANSSSQVNQLVCTSVHRCLLLGQIEGPDGSFQRPTISLTDAQGRAPSAVSLPQGSPEPPLSSLSCPGPSSCFAVGSGTLLTSGNGGATWTSATPPPNATDTSQITCPSVQVCYVSGTLPEHPGQAVARTDDRGHTWQVLTSLDAGTVASNRLLQFECPSIGYCGALVIAGSKTHLLTSNKPGAVWSELRLPLTPWGAIAADSFWCSSSKWCVVAGTANPQGRVGPGQPLVAVTADGGAHWRVQHLPYEIPLIPSQIQVTCSRPQDCVALLSAVAFATGNGWRSFSTDILHPGEVGMPPPGSPFGPIPLACPSPTQCLAAVPSPDSASSRLLVRPNS